MSRHQGAASSQSLPLMGSYMRRRGVIGILFSQIDFWTHSRCLQSAPPPRWASHCPPFPIWNRLLAQHRTAYCWHSLLLLMCPELTTSCSSGGRVNIWAPGILEHGLGSGGWCPTIQLRSPPGAAVSVYDGGALGAAGPAREGNSANKGGSMSSSS